MKPYDSDFFGQLQHGSQQSAEVVVPLIKEWVNPKSVVDVGCGDGTWLSVFQAYGVKDILGMDGTYVEREILQIPTDCFIPFDLSQPVSIDRTFDLAVSLEVAEHLPEASAQEFVKSLVRLSDVVLFSAAIPHQGGTNHINEQWPDYWIALFEADGYSVVDVLRERIWNHHEVQPWYAQNSFLFVRRDRLSDYPVLQNIFSQSNQPGPALVHPTIYLQHCPTSSSESQQESPKLEQSQTIQILGVTLHPSTEIQTGEALTIEISYQILSPVEAAIFNLSLSNEAGTKYLDIDTIITSGLSQGNLPHSIYLQIKRLDLVQGTYFVNPGIFSRDWTHTYDFHWHRYQIKITAVTHQKGLLCPPMDWHKSIDTLNE